MFDYFVQSIEERGEYPEYQLVPTLIFISNIFGLSIAYQVVEDLLNMNLGGRSHGCLYNGLNGLQGQRRRYVNSCYIYEARVGGDGHGDTQQRDQQAASIVGIVVGC